MPETCAVIAIEMYAKAAKSCKWKKERKGYPEIKPIADLTQARKCGPSEPQNDAGQGAQEKGFTMHSFRVRTAVALGHCRRLY